MNKKLLTIAVAAALAAPMSVLAGSDVTLYGKAHLSQDYVDADSNIQKDPGAGDTKAPFSGWDTVSRASRLGVKGSEDLGGGLKAIFKMEFQVNMSNDNNDLNDNDKGSIKMRNTYVGLSGKWGTALMGRHDTPLKVSTGRLDLFSDYLADYNATVGFFDVRADNTVAYISPSWNGLTGAVAIMSPGGSTLDGFGNGNSDGPADAYSAAVMYKNGGWYGSAAYEFYKDDTVTANADEDFKLWRLGFGYDAESWTINAIYEGHKDDPTTSQPGIAGVTSQGGSDPYMYQIQGQYKFGNNAVKAMWGHYDSDGSTTANLATYGNASNEDHDTYAIGIDHNFSKRTTVYLVYTDYDSDYKDSDWNGGSLGMIHKF